MTDPKIIPTEDVEQEEGGSDEEPGTVDGLHDPDGGEG